MKIKVYKSIFTGPVAATHYSLNKIQFSFVRGKTLYHYICSPDWYVSYSGGLWGHTGASKCATESSWLEVLVCTGRSRAEIEREIKKADNMKADNGTHHTQG